MNRDQARAELEALAASLRAYVEYHDDAGTFGFPRDPSLAMRGVSALSRAGVGADRTRVPAGAAGGDAGRTAGATDRPGLPRVADGRGSGSASEAASSSPSPSPVSEERPMDGATERTPNVRLSQLAAEVASCTRCALAGARTQTVFSRGNPLAALCFVGEAPGADEDEQGVPFVGRAGQLLDRMIGAMGLSPERDVYVCNIIKCRPPGNRRPEPEETASCIPYMHEQLALVKPKIIVALGNTAVAALLDTKLGITKVRGEWKLYRGQTLVMPTYHPSYLLRPGAQQLEAKRQAWQDLQLVMRELKQG